MGRDKPKKYSKMGYFEKESYKDDMAKKLGIQGTEYRDSRGNTQTRRNDKALKSAIKNDFDYRTSAQHMDGVKGNGSMGDFTKYERSAVKLHKKAGNGGQYSSNKDITGVTNNLVKDYRRGIQDQIKGASTEDQQKQAQSGEAYTPSTELADARNTVEEFDNKDFNVYNRGNATGAADAGDGDGQRQQAAQTFLDKYKFDVKQKANFRPTI